MITNYYYYYILVMADIMKSSRRTLKELIEPQLCEQQQIAEYRIITFCLTIKIWCSIKNNNFNP